jgi:zinc D-Ala-D-Ala carboxypeptidase
MRFPTKVSETFKAQFANPLDKFRSYSFYHVWVLARNEEAALRVFNEANIEQVLSPPSEKRLGGVRTPITLNDNPNDPNSQVIVLINGARDADFIIERYDAVGVAQAPIFATGSNTMVSQEITIELSEPMGVRFVNVYRQALIDLGVANTDCVSVIKTIFVGTTEDGRQERYTDVPPTFLMFADMMVNINELGAVYHLKFLHNLAVGFSKSLSNNSTGITLQMGGSVASALDTIARTYTKDAENNSKVVGGRPLKYRIIFDESMKEVGNWAINGGTNRTEGRNGTNPVAIGANVSIEQAIAMVFDNCGQYLDQATKSDSPDAFRYKIVSSIYRTATSAEVVYMLIRYNWQKRYELSRLALEYAERNPSNSHPEADAFGADAPVLIFDYIFTGKNTDILQFDMKIDEGLGFFTSLTNINNLSDTAQQGQVVTSGTTVHPSSNQNSSSGDANRTVGPRQSSNLLLSKNNSLAVRKAQYDAEMFAHLSIEASKMGAVLRIRGNPGFLSCFAIDPKMIARPDEKSSGHGFSPSEFYTDKIPYVFINVQMPDSWTGSQNYTASPTSMEKFWYRGVWEVITVKTILDQSGFVVELDLLAAPAHPVAKTTPRTTQLTSETGQVQMIETSEDKPTTPPPPKPQVGGVEGSRNQQMMKESTRYDTQITTHFKYGDILKTSKVDWQRGQNDPPDETTFDNLMFTLEQMEKIRHALGTPVSITSGYRNETVNKKVGGAQNSDHKSGLAVDFQSPQFGSSGDPVEIVRFIQGLDIPFKQLIIEKPPTSKRGWVHVSFSRSPAGNKRQVLSYNGSAYSAYTQPTKRGG